MKCPGYEIENGSYTGCKAYETGKNDCGVCEGTGQIVFCPRCTEHLAISGVDLGCPNCGWDSIEIVGISGVNH